MTLSIRVEGNRDIEHMRRAIKSIGGTALPRAMDTAFNRVLPTVRSRITKAVAARTGVTPQKHIRNRMKLLKRKNFKAIRIITGDMPAGLLKPKQLKSGVKAGKTNYPGAFLINTPGRVNQRVYKREGAPRYPIEQQKINVHTAFVSLAPGIASRTVNERFPVEFERALQAQVRRLTKRRRR